jgi:hypothetical protein
MRKLRVLIPGAIAGLTLAALVASSAAAATPSFTNTPLLRPAGGSEPAISIAGNGTMAITALQWLFDPTSVGTYLWTGPFGATPTFQGLLDANLQQPAKNLFGGEDADVDIASTGTLHATTLVALVNPPFKAATLGVSAISCPGATSATFALGGCTEQVIDTAGADRPFITSDGPHVWIAYHDAGNSSQIHIQRSDDDGLTWRRVADPIVGQGQATGQATFNNDIGPIVADPSTHNLYLGYIAGEPGLQKAKNFFHNNVRVARSTDGGLSWTSSLVYHAPVNDRLNNFFATVTVDPTNGNVYTSWTDTHSTWVAKSTDQATTWSTQVVNAAPANTTVEPSVAARGGTVDVVYYGTDASSNVDPSAVWNVYLAQSTDGGTSYAQSVVSLTPNHVGVLCVNGTACVNPEQTRTLLDLFETAIDPANGKTAVVYTDDTLTKTTSGLPLPQIVLAQQQ